MKLKCLVFFAPFVKAKTARSQGAGQNPYFTRGAGKSFGFGIKVVCDIWTPLAPSSVARLESSFGAFPTSIAQRRIPAASQRSATPDNAHLHTGSYMTK